MGGGGGDKVDVREFRLVIAKPLSILVSYNNESTQNQQDEGGGGGILFAQGHVPFCQKMPYGRVHVPQ